MTIADSQVGPSLTITADRATYGMEVDNVVFTVTRTGMSDSEITAGVTLVQDDTYLPAGRLQWTIRIPPDQTTATHTIYGEFFTGGATRSGDLTAMLMPAPGIEVGDPITVRMVVLDPAITVRSERAAWRFVEDDAAPAVAFVARTAPGLPRPNTVFDVAISTASRRDGAESPGDYAAVSQMVRFEPVDFAAAGGEWEARKEVALSIVDDGEAEGDETFDLYLGRAPGLPGRIRLRQTDGSVCPDDVCAVPATISDNDPPPTLTIAAQQESYGFGIDAVVFTVTRTGTAAEEISGAVNLTQDENFVSSILRLSFTISADETSTEVEVFRSLFDGNATQSGNLTATIEAGDGYTVGMPGSATVRMVVADPAITVRPERAAYRFAEGVGEATIAVVARTAPEVPPPDGTFPMQVFSEHTSGTGDGGRRLRSAANQRGLRHRRFHRRGRHLGGTKGGLANDRRRRRGGSRRDHRIAAPGPIRLLRRSGSGRAMPMVVRALTMSAPCRSRSPPTMDRRWPGSRLRRFRRRQAPTTAPTTSRTTFSPCRTTRCTEGAPR